MGFESYQDKARLSRGIIADNIDKHPVGRQLTPEAREQAISHGVAVWKGPMGNGTAAEIGIKHATSSVLKDK